VRNQSEYKKLRRDSAANLDDLVEGLKELIEEGEDR